MLLRIVGTSPDADTLLARVQASLEEIGLLGHTEVEIYDTPEYRVQMKISNTPALCIEESAIDFRDMIFEGVVPEQSELKSLFISLFGGEEKKRAAVPVVRKVVANPALLAKNLSLEIQSINNKAQKTGLSLIIAILLLNIINSSIVGKNLFSSL